MNFFLTIFNITGSKHFLTALQGQNLAPFFNITGSKHVLTALQGRLHIRDTSLRIGVLMKYLTGYILAYE